jgi:hypothetical protein
MSRAFALRTDDNALKAVTVTVTASTSGTSSADPELVGGRIISIFPTSSGGQHIASVALGATGIVTVTLASSDTATYTVIVQKEN